MAGFIHINDKDGLSLGRISFNAIVEFTRPFFPKETKKTLEEIYDPVDNGGLDIITLVGQGEEAFNNYYKGIYKAYETCLKDKHCGELDSQYYEMVMGSFKDLINLLEIDERFKPSTNTSPNS